MRHELDQSTSASATGKRRSGRSSHRQQVLGRRAANRVRRASPYSVEHTEASELRVLAFRIPHAGPAADDAVRQLAEPMLAGDHDPRPDDAAVLAGKPAGGTKKPFSVHRVKYHTEWRRAEHGRAPETAMSNRILGRLRPRGGEGRWRRSQSQARSENAATVTGSSGAPADAGTATEYEIVRTTEEWKTILTPEQYHVLRRHGTERAGSSPLNFEKRTGTFLCAGCGLALYSAEAKFDSGTGWPSFWESIEGAVDTSLDRSFFMTRTEVHCRRCGGHLGHVFSDGPPPTGERHCVNGLALKFEPD